MMRVKVFITIDIDPDEYPVPADENVERGNRRRYP